MAAGSVVAVWSQSGQRSKRYLAIALVACIAVDYVSLGHRLMPIAFSIKPQESHFPGPFVPPLMNVERCEIDGQFGSIYPQPIEYAAVLRGYGVIRGQEPQFGYDLRGPTATITC